MLLSWRRAETAAQLVGTTTGHAVVVGAWRVAPVVVEHQALLGQGREGEGVPVLVHTRQRNVPHAKLPRKGGAHLGARAVTAALIHAVLAQQGFGAHTPDILDGGRGRAGGGGAALSAHALVVLPVVLLILLAPPRVEVLQLSKVLATADERCQRGRVLSGAVPRTGGVAQPVGRIGNPLFALERHATDLEDAHLAVPGGEGEARGGGGRGAACAEGAAWVRIRVRGGVG
eukprot:scaffold12605_cov114-Isochrysis_galbana.AAC.3